jgi:peroxiredoxin
VDALNSAWNPHMTLKSFNEILEEKFVQCRDMDASLGERLQAFADEVERLGPHFTVAIDKMIDRLRAHDAGSTAPNPGDPMPPFMLPDDQGRLIRLDELLGKGPAAISFNRGYWCPYCRLNTEALARAQEEIGPNGGQIVAITPDRQKFNIELKNDARAPFPILTDMDNGYALSLDLAIWVGSELAGMMEGAGFNPGVSQGGENWMLPIPATFVVGRDGLVKARFIDPDYRKRPAIEEVLGALRAAR